jgi:preprotein translocase subunit SecG
LDCFVHPLLVLVLVLVPAVLLVVVLVHHEMMNGGAAAASAWWSDVVGASAWHVAGVPRFVFVCTCICSTMSQLQQLWRVKRPNSTPS